MSLFKKQAPRSQYNPPCEVLQCEECGGQHNLALIYNKLRCQACALRFIHAVQQGEQAKNAKGARR
jgi:hypothetical protein